MNMNGKEFTSIDAGGNYRYPGSRPFYDTINDRRLFFGRDKEVQLLLYEILTTNLVILYGKSGLGKTSLLNAGLSPLLRDRGFLPFKARFNNEDIKPLDAVFEGIKEMKKKHPDHEEVKKDKEDKKGKKISLWQYFKTAAFWGPGNKLLTPVLIMDQFEDFFNSYSVEDRKKFTRHLAYLVNNIIPPEVLDRWDAKKRPFPYSDNPPNIKVIISIREDYLGQLEEMYENIPGILHRRIRLLPLGREQARQAIVGPTRVKVQAIGAAPLEFQPDAREMMLDFLCKPKNKDSSQKTHGVEPFQLQLLCSNIEKKVLDKPGKRKGKVEKADLGGEAGMNKVLQNYYEDRLKEIGPVWKKRRVRKLFTKGLITPLNRRSFLGEEDIKNRFKIKKGLLEVLVNNRLLRAEPRLGTPYYELSHDSLIEPIRNSQKKSRRKKLRMIVGIGFLFALIIIAYLSLFKKEKEPFIYSLSQKIPISQTKQGKDKIEVKEIDPEGAVIYYYIGCTHYFNREYKKALDKFHRAIEIDLDYVYAYNGLGMTFFEMGKYDEAIEYYKDAIDIKKNYPYAYSNLGVALITMGKEEEAIENFKKATKIKKDYVDAYYNWGYALIVKKMYNEAIEKFNQALDLDPYYVYAYIGLGLCLHAKENYDGAIKKYEKAIKIDPNYIYTYFELGNILVEIKYYDRAKKYYEKAIEIDPNFANAYCGIGIVLYYKEDYDQAIEKFNKAIELEPEFAEAYYYKGLSFYHKNNNSKSLGNLKKAVEIDPKAADYKTTYVEINLLTNHFDEAFSLAEKYLKEKDIPSKNKLVMKFIAITSLLLQGKKQPDAADCDEFIKYYKSLRPGLKKVWDFCLIKNFINKATDKELPKVQKVQLIKLIKILKSPGKVQEKAEKELKELCGIE